MGSNKQPGIALDPATVQPVVDGLLCRAPPTRVGTLLHASVLAATSPPAFIYCHLWSNAERGAFWRGFLERLGEFGDELKIYFLWFRKAFFFGEKEGDFAQAWESFASGIGDLAILSGKIAVVAGVPWPMQFHPKRRQYEEELKNLGLQLTKEFIAGYEKSYKAGGIPQCTGRLLADLLRIVFEILATKGAGKVAAGAGKLASSGKIAQVLEKLPGPLKTLPAKLAQPPTRWQLIDYIRHDEKAALYARGMLYDLKPGEFLVRVEARHAPGPGNWFNGPFKTADQAKEYAEYLANMGEKGIREVSALPLVWEGGSPGSKVEVIRIYRVARETPAIGSVVAPQKEGLAKAATGAANASKDAANASKGASPVVRAGQGQQLSLPVTQAEQVHGLKLVERFDWLEILITKK
jgi:hypothetical protein